MKKTGADGEDSPRIPLCFVRKGYRQHLKGLFILKEIT